MPQTAVWVCKTDVELARIRAGLLTPRRLFATVQERFLAADASHDAAWRDRNRLVSAGNPDHLVMWATPDGWCCMARHKGEARATWKKTCGRKIPKGMKFVRVGVGA